MTTKDCYLSLKGKHEILFPSKGQYSDLNLNQVNKHSNIFSINQTPASNVSSRKEDYSIFGERNNCRGNNILWKKSNFGTTDCLNFGQDFNGKKDQRKDLIKRSDNLELHIASYESYLKSIGAADINPNSADSRKEKSGSSNKWKSTKDLWTNLSSAVQDPFEYPRMPTNEPLQNPEPVEFKASQKLFNASAIGVNPIKVQPPIFNGQIKKYKLLGQLSSQIFKAQELDSGLPVVIKLYGENDELKWKKEREVYALISTIKSDHFMSILDHGCYEKQKFLVLPLLEGDLTSKFPKDHNDSPSPQLLGNFTKVILAKQILQALEHLHSIGFVHSNLSWRTFGITKNNNVVVLQLWDALKVGQEPSKNDTSPALTYASRALHSGNKLAFKDDIESFSYLIAEMFTSLPWTIGQYSSEDLGIFKADELSKDSPFMKRLPYSLRFLMLSVDKLKYGKTVPYQRYQNNLSHLFAVKELEPILDWHPKHVYKGKLTPAHLAVDYYLDIYDGRWCIVSKCRVHIQDKFKKNSFVNEQCGCTFVIPECLSLEKFLVIKDSEIVKKSFCKDHLPEATYPHICCDDETKHPFFGNKFAQKQLDNHVNLSDYNEDLIAQMDALTATTARSEFIESDFPDAHTPNYLPE